MLLPENKKMAIFGVVLLVLGIAGMVATQAIMRQPGDFIIVFDFGNLPLVLGYAVSALVFGAGANMVAWAFRSKVGLAVVLVLCLSTSVIMAAVSGTLLGRLRSGIY